MNQQFNYLVVFDTDRIKEYIFATNRLKEIRGASTLLSELNEKQKLEEIIKPICEHKIVYSAGGGAAVLVPDKQAAEQVVEEVERWFVENAASATITGAVHGPLPPNYEENFGEQMKVAGKQLRSVKSQKAALFTLPVEPYLRLCDSCGRYIAVAQASDGSENWLCASCGIKREKGNEAAYHSKFLEWIRGQTDSRGHGVGTQRPDDLDAIGQVARPPNYVGFIVADGNKMGDTLYRLKRVAEYEEYAERLKNAMEQEVTFAALHECSKPRERNIMPFEILLIGGDDVRLVTAADIAIPFALKLAEKFEQRVTELNRGSQMEEATLAAGVVLARADFPLPALQELAEELLKSAKQYCSHIQYKSSAIDFLVVSGSDTDLDAARAAVPHRRPYARQDLAKLIRSIRELKILDFPTSQLQAMYQALFQTKINAEMASIAALGRLGRSAKDSEHYLQQLQGAQTPSDELGRSNNNTNRYDALRKFFKDFGSDFNNRLPPWSDEMGDEGKSRSALADLVELYPFIDEKGESDDTNSD